MRFAPAVVNASAAEADENLSSPLADLRVLMPTIVDPAVHRGGAWTSTRGVVAGLQRAPWHARVTALTVPEPRWRRLAQVRALITARVSRYPAKVQFVRDRGYRNDVRRHLAQGEYDLVLVNGSDLLWCLDDVPPRARVVVFVHNHEAHLMREQIATIVRPAAMRRFLERECERLHAFELDALRRVHGAIFLSNDDAHALGGQVSGLETLVLPPQFAGPAARIEKEASAHLDLGFLANFHWWPNREGAQWFLRRVLPALPDDVRVHLFGTGSETVVARDARVVTHGFVAHLDDVWRRCDAMISPIRRGAGVSVKVAESLYYGVPVLSTPFGTRGLGPSLPGLVTLASAEEWIAYLNGAEARRIGAARLPLEASRPFDVASNAPRLDRFIARVLQGASSAPM